MTSKRTAALIRECERQAESCLYTSAALYIWQKHAARWRAVFLVAPIILGGVAGSQILIDYGGNWGKFGGALCGVLAGFFPAIFVSLNMDMRVAEIARSAGEFTSLKDRFRQAATVRAEAPFDEFQAAFEGLMDRMDAVRMAAPPSPEWCFRQAQKKISKGDYTFSADKKS